MSYKTMIRFVCVLTIPFCAVSASANETLLYSQLTDGYWQIWAKDMESNAAAQLTYSEVDKRAPQCHKEKNKVLYQTANAEVMVFDLTSQQETQILQPFGSIRDQRFSDDGARVAFSRIRSDIIDDSDVWIADKDGGNQQVLDSGLGHQYNIVWLNSDTIIYTAQNKENNSHNLWKLNVTDKKKEQLTDGVFYDILSAVQRNVDEIVFASNRGGNYDIWSVNLKTKQLKRLTRYEGLDTSPTISTDGSKIVFVSTQSGSKQLWQMNLDGTGQQSLTDNTTPRQDPFWCAELTGIEK